MTIGDEIRHAAAELIQLGIASGLHVVTAESLTGGQLAAAIVDIPGASAVFTGGAVAYATDLKASLLGVDAEFLAEHGPVNAEVAKQLATGARRVLGIEDFANTIAIATTGVAGPDSQGGQQPGTVFIAVVSARDTVVQELHFDGERSIIQQHTVLAALRSACEVAGSAASGYSRE